MHTPSAGRDQEAARPFLERGLPDLIGERSHVLAKSSATSASPKMRLDHRPLEVRKLTVELERHLAPNTIANKSRRKSHIPCDDTEPRWLGGVDVDDVRAGCHRSRLGEIERL